MPQMTNAQYEWENPHYELDLVVTGKAAGAAALELLDTLISAHLDTLTGPEPDFKLLPGHTKSELAVAQRASCYILMLQRALTAEPARGIDTRLPPVAEPMPAAEIAQPSDLWLAQNAWLSRYKPGEPVAVSTLRTTITREQMTLLRAADLLDMSGNGWIYRAPVATATGGK